MPPSRLLGALALVAGVVTVQVTAQPNCPGTSPVRPGEVINVHVAPHTHGAFRGAARRAGGTASRDRVRTDRARVSRQPSGDPTPPTPAAPPSRARAPRA